jgi:hypothetical protein
VALGIDWPNRLILVPQADLTPLGPGLFQLDLNAFRLELKDREDDVDGMVYLDTHRHNTETTLSGTTFARSVEIINGYRVEFEDVGGPYTVVVSGGNHNIADVKIVNQVSLVVNNSAGLVVGQGAVDPAAIAVAVRAALRDDLTIINEGVQDSSLLIPHDTDLAP